MGPRGVGCWPLLVSVLRLLDFAAVFVGSGDLDQLDVTFFVADDGRARGETVGQQKAVGGAAGLRDGENPEIEAARTRWGLERGTRSRGRWR